MRTTIFALEDNRVPQCNARIANRGSLRDRRRGHRNKIHFRNSPVAIETQCCRDCKARITSVLLRASLIAKSAREQSIFSKNREKKYKNRYISTRYYYFRNCLRNGKKLCRKKIDNLVILRFLSILNNVANKLLAL